jgi:hypothetical protein
MKGEHMQFHNSPRIIAQVPIALLLASTPICARNVFSPQAVRNIKISRAVRLVRTGSNTRAACRAVDLYDAAAVSAVKRICDQRGIPRRHWWGTPHWKTTDPPFPAYVKSRARRKARDTTDNPADAPT